MQLTDHIGRVLAERYRLIAPVGAGSSALVFVADDTKLKRRVAVKVLHPALADDQQFLDRFRTEAQAAAQLNHPNVLAVYDWGDDDMPFIVTEFLPGGSLRSMLDREELSASQVLLIGLDALKGLDYAHRQGFVHRDIKPGNLLFDAEGRLRIADFGLARALAEAGWTEPSDTLVGTVRYASPEQARGESVSEKSDVYALALVLYEALTGEVPFATDTTFGTLMARVDQTLPDHENLGLLASPLTRAAAPHVDDRLDAGELGVSLMALAEEMPRPQPLPIAGAITYETTIELDPDPTMIGGGPSVEGPETAKPKWSNGSTPKPEGPAPRTPDIDDDESAGARWPWMVFFALLTVGLAIGGWFVVQSSAGTVHEVPILVGLDLSAAQDQIADFNWDVQPFQDRSDDVAVGAVIRTDPEAGLELDEGEVFKITVSIGPSLVDLPTGISETAPSEVERQLIELGLTLGEETREVSENVDANLVIRFNTGNSEVELGSAVPVVISDGPAPRSVPEDLVGRTCEVATERLGELRLDTTCVEVFDDDVRAGRIISVSPESGEVVPVGATIELQVSKGPEPRPFPNVINMTVPEANAALREAGFCSQSVDGPADGIVIGQNPLAEDGPQLPGTCADLIARES